MILKIKKSKENDEKSFNFVHFKRKKYKILPHFSLSIGEGLWRTRENG